MVRPWSLAAAGAVLVLGSATAGSAEAGTTACYAGSLGGQAAVRSGWADDRPGLCRLVTRSALPPPFATASADNHPHAIPRPAGALPKAPPGFRVSLFFQDGTAPRQLRAAPNGDLFLAESYAGQVRVLRPDGKGGLATSAVFATGRYRPFGIAFYPPGPNPAWVYVADNDKVVRYPYANGDLTARGPAQTVVPSLPQGGQLPGGGHWTRDLAFARDGSRLYVSVGSFSNDQNDGEDETGRADVLSFAPDGSGRQVVADGIRNPVSLAVEPRSGELWATVNERDGLGDNLVPDYVTRVRQGQFFGWPWYYLGRNLDPRHASDAPQVGTITVPDLLLQAHSASLGLTFYATGPFPGRYRNSAFVALHGSWNRANQTDSKVVFAKVKDGALAKRYEDFLTGFTVAAPAQPDGTGTWGRPVGVAAGRDGALYVSDDLGNVVWRVAYQP